MTAAAAPGAELFELDAGWYEGAGERDPFDFAPGLGTWGVDPKSFRTACASWPIAPTASG